MHCLSNFSKKLSLYFLLLLLSINTKLAYVFTTILPPFGSCYLASVCLICCCFESRKRLTVELYTVLLLLVSALLYNGFFVFFYVYDVSAKILHGKTCVLLF